jgi:hypothetical protein
VETQVLFLSFLPPAPRFIGSNLRDLVLLVHYLKIMATRQTQEIKTKHLQFLEKYDNIIAL